MNNTSDEKVWFNIQGQYLIKTTYYPHTKTYHTTKMKWNVFPTIKK